MDDMPNRIKPLFYPRPALRFLPGVDHAAEDRHTAVIHATGPYMKKLKKSHEKQAAKKQADKAKKEAGEPVEEEKPTWFEKDIAKKLEMEAYNKYQLTQGVKDRQKERDEDSKILKNAETTIFIAHLDYKTTEKSLTSHFRNIGSIDQVRVITHDEAKAAKCLKSFNGNERPIAPNRITKKKEKRDRKFANKQNMGYAFMSFKTAADAKAAIEKMNDSVLDGRRIFVDTQRGNGQDDKFVSRKDGGGLGKRGWTKEGGHRSALAGQSGNTGTFHARRDFYGRGGGGFRGGRGGGGGGYGGRGGIGYRDAPDGAPAGPRGGGRSGYGGGRENGHGGGRYEDRDRGASGTNMEPLGRRDRGFGGGDRDGGSRRDGGFHDRDRDRERDRERGSRRHYDDRDQPPRDYDRGRDEDRKRRRYDDDTREGDPRRRRM